MVKHPKTSPTPERRDGDRRPVTIPTRIDTEARDGRFGVIWNVSPTGALLATPTRFQIADRAKLELRAKGHVPHGVEARIVRLEVNDVRKAGIFRYLMAVRFLEPIPDELLDVG